MTTREKLWWAYIVDYACRYRHESVIQAALDKTRSNLASLGVPHARLASAALHKIVHHELVHQFPTAIRLLQQLFHELGDQSDPAFVRSFIKLLCGLKVKAFLYSLEESPQDALRALTEYFPREIAGVDDIVMSPELAEELKEATRAFRKSMYPIILHPAKREEFMANQSKELYGADFNRILKRRVTFILDTLEQQWPDPYIDQVIKQQQEGKTVHDASSPSPPHDLTYILLDLVEGKSSLSSQDLLDLIDLLDPQRPLEMQGFTPSFFSSQQVSQPSDPQVEPEKGAISSPPTASHEHVISSSSNTNTSTTHSNPTNTQPVQEMERTAVQQPTSNKKQSKASLSRRRSSSSLRQWNVFIENVVDGSISDVDDRDQQRKDRADMEGYSSIEGEEVVPSSSYSTAGDDEDCLQESKSPSGRTNGKRTRTRTHPYKRPQTFSSRREKTQSEDTRRLHPNIRSHQKDDALQLCVVKLLRQPELDSLDPQRGFLNIAEYSAS